MKPLWYIIIGHEFEPLISCPLHICFTHGRIFIKLKLNVCLGETMCRTHKSTMPTQGQGHNWRSRVWAFDFVSSPYLLNSLIFFFNFGQMLASVRRCTEPTQPCRFKVKVTIEGHEFEPLISCSLLISWTLWKIFIKLWPNVRLSETMCRTYNSAMPTQGHGHGHNWRSRVWTFDFVSAPYLVYPWKDFH